MANGLAKVPPRFRAAVYVATRLPGKDERAPNGKQYDLKIVASTSRVARDHGLIESGAWIKDLKFFRANPVIQWAHDYSLPPIAVAVDVAADDRGNLLQWWRFLTGLTEDEWDRFAGRVRTLYQVGGMRAASVGWQTLQYREPSQEERQEAILKGEREPMWVVVRGELLETSAVPVPADPYALAVDRALREAGAKQSKEIGPLAAIWGHLKKENAEHPLLIAAGEKALPSMPDRIKEALADPRFAIPVSWPGFERDAEPEKVEAEAEAEADSGDQGTDGEREKTYKCSACGHVQAQGGSCEECGSDQMEASGGDADEKSGEEGGEAKDVVEALDDLTADLPPEAEGEEPIPEAHALAELQAVLRKWDGRVQTEVQDATDSLDEVLEDLGAERSESPAGDGDVDEQTLRRIIREEVTAALREQRR